MTKTIQELIKINKNEEGIQTVNAKDLHKKLEVGNDFSTWLKMRIKKYGFIEGIDYTSLKSTPVNGGVAIDYYISLNMSKELSMVENNDIGRELRRYFIQCEKKLQEPYYIPKTHLEAMQFATEKMVELEYKDKIIEEMDGQLQIQQPKVDFYDTIIISNTTINMKEVAKILNYEGVGRNNLFKILRQKNIIDDKNQPYQQYIDRGYFKMVVSDYVKPNGDIHTKMVSYQKGVHFIKRILDKEYLTKEVNLIKDFIGEIR